MTDSVSPRPDRTIKLLLSIIAGALTLIALSPFIAPLPTQAQAQRPTLPSTPDPVDAARARAAVATARAEAANAVFAAAAAGAGTSIAIQGQPAEGQTALVSFKGPQGEQIVSVLTFRRGEWTKTAKIPL
jgi:hypothetical protein